MEDLIISKLVAVLLIEFLILMAPFIFILADLWSGVRKAKQRGEAITSRKLRDTVQKIARYYNILLVLGVLDAMQLACIWYMNTYEGWALPMFPWLTFIGSACVGAIEVKSILEPANEKEERQLHDIVVLAKAIAEHKSDPKEIAIAIAEYLKSEQKE